MITKYTVVWQSYGQWHATSPFDHSAEAQKHIDKIILRRDIINPEKYERDYNKNVQIIAIEVDEASGENQ